MKKYYMLLVILITISTIGCINRINIVDPAGRVFPTPHYVSMSTFDYGIQAISYWSTNTKIKDLDGTLITRSSFINYTDNHMFSINKVESVTLTIEVSNPNKIPYKLIEERKVTNRTGVNNLKKEVGSSNLPYRKYVFELPLEVETKFSYGVTLTIDDFPMIYFGDINYLSYKGGDD